MSLFNELKRRNVFKVAIAYGIVSWIVLQVGSIAFPALNLPEWTMTMLIVFTLIGFPFVMLFAWAFELTAEGIKRTGDVSAAESIATSTSNKLNYFVIGGLAVALMLVVVDSYVLDEGITGTGVEVTEQSIAVLPFANLSSDAEQEYFADGISEELLNSITRLDGLLVAGRTSSFYFKDRSEDLRTIGEILGVEHLLQGSVRKSGDEVRISAQLIEAGTGFQLWSQVFERSIDDIFAIQDEIAEEVAEALSISLGVGDLGTYPGMTRNVEAYDLYLQGKNLIGSIEQLSQGVELLENAVELDPDFALAWARLAPKYRYIGARVPFNQRPQYLERGNDAILKAIALSPNTPEIVALRAREAADNNEWIKAEQIIREAEEDYGIAMSELLGNFLMSVGKSREAIRYLEQAKRFDPLSPSVSINLADTLADANSYTDSIIEFERRLDMSEEALPDVLGARLVQAMAAGTVEEVQEYARLTIQAGDIANVVNETMLNNLDDLQTARLELNVLAQDPEALLNETGVLGVFAAMVWASYLGELEIAEALMIRLNSPNLLWRPVHEGIRHRDGIKTFLKERGLINYYRSNGWNDYCQPIEGGDDFECF